MWKCKCIAKLLARQTLKSSWASKSSCLTCLILPVTRWNRSYHIWYENWRGKSFQNVWQFVALQDLLSIWHYRIQIVWLNKHLKILQQFIWSVITSQSIKGIQRKDQKEHFSWSKISETNQMWSLGNDWITKGFFFSGHCCTKIFQIRWFSPPTSSDFHRFC